jgi:hypothetical protein
MPSLRVPARRRPVAVRLPQVPGPKPPAVAPLQVAAQEQVRARVLVRASKAE